MPTHKQLANAIRVLSMDAVQKANSGHPGMPMGMADIAEVLWNDFLQHNPLNPHWINRDRFMLSNGHGSMLLYSLLHLTGYDLSLDEIKRFRQLHSKTPGHPEYHETPGVETTTGPLGQGLANAVGMAIAEKHSAKIFNRDGFNIIDHFTYVFVGDGCLMEGISHEACSLAGTLGLGKLIVFYDDNDISIDGNVSGWFQDNTPERFAAYHWHVVPNVDGHDREAVKKAIIAAQAVTDKPSLICCKTIIGWGAPTLAGSAKTHGAALGEAEVALVRKKLAWDYAPFEIPQEYYAAWDARDKGNQREKQWQDLFAAYQKKFPELSQELLRRIEKRLPENWKTIAEQALQDAFTKKESMATRKASLHCLNAFAPALPELLGGSADLTESNLTDWKGAQVFSRANPEGRYIHYGVREFGMTAIMTGMALYGGIIPFGGTFLTFSDYARNAIRLASMMKQRVIYVYTHDSIGLGEDGPTHQPVEHISSLRLMPQLSLWRPCDWVETVVAWREAITHQGPTCLLLTRQACPAEEHSLQSLQQIEKGGYILLDGGPDPEVILIATGSEVSLATAAAKQLPDVKIRVVSMPSTDRFMLQDPAYREKVLPAKIKKRIAIEAGASDYWYKFVGLEGKVVGVDRFGASAPVKDVMKECGFSVEHIISVIKTIQENTNVYSSCN